MKRRLFISFCLSSIGLAFVAGSLEVLVRLFMEQDTDGNSWFRSKQLRPYHLPIQRVRSLINSYTEASNSYMIYDSQIGWSIRPNSVSKDKLYKSNSAGLRSEPKEYSLRPEHAKLRIAIFGDSFVHGDDIPFGETWGHYLEQNLTNDGIRTEVLNFGVGGYGIDQTYLRWINLGKAFSPHIVILGFQPENILRNVNLIRPIYYLKTGIPFQKPRFILKNDKLELIGVPSLEPPEIVSGLKNWDTYSLRPYEYWYNENYKDHWYLHSKLVSLILAELYENPFNQCSTLNRRYFSSSEAIQLSIAIIRQFKEDVEQRGAKFFVVNLPTQQDLMCMLRSEKLPYQGILDLLPKEIGIQLIHPEMQMFSFASVESIDKLFTGHYSKYANRFIANELAKEILIWRTTKSYMTH